jgi:hypothetical protein
MWVVPGTPETVENTMFPSELMVFAWHATHPVRTIPVGCPENCGGRPWQVAPHAPLSGETQLGVCRTPGVLSVLSGSPPPWQYAPEQVIRVGFQVGEALCARARVPDPATLGKTAARTTAPGA